MGSYRRPIGSQYRDPGVVHKFSKQQFLQANCQFVVLDGHDYSVHKADPDWPIEWDCVEEVRFRQSASTETTCPICLDYPVAAKITRCGHIYCWPCMLQYLSLSDENCRQCPICFEPVYKNDLRSVTSHMFINYSVGDEITMRLMARNKGCVEVEPYMVEPQTSLQPVEPKTMQQQSLSSEDGGDITTNTTTTTTILEGSHYWSQANLVIVDSMTVITKIAQREREELLAKLEADKNEPEVCFVESALNWLDKRVERLQARNSNVMSGRTINNHQSQAASPQPHQQTSTNEPSKSYLFYQCSDGQHIYLNPFSTKILCHHFKSLHECPLEIKAKILQMDWISMREAWRKRFRYLEHLPLTCEFRLIEIDFEKSNLISPETFRVFEGQIRKREQERDRRRKEERKRERIIQVEQNRKIYGIQPLLKINLDNIDQFPSVSDERYLGLSLPRNLVRNDNENDLSSDEETANGGTSAQTLSSDIPTNQQTVAADQLVSGQNGEDHESMISGVALSFRDIQLQEAALAARGASRSSGKSLANVLTQNSGRQRGGTSSNGGPQSSSFAQLLVNAKTSQKQWTRNVSSTVSGSNNNSSSISSNHTSQNRASRTTSESEECSEEFRPLPSAGFTISDFIDMNTASTTGKKKGKPKNSCKKG